MLLGFSAFLPFFCPSFLPSFLLWSDTTLWQAATGAATTHVQNPAAAWEFAQTHGRAWTSAATKKKKRKKRLLWLECLISWWRIWRRDLGQHPPSRVAFILESSGRMAKVTTCDEEVVGWKDATDEAARLCRLTFFVRRWAQCCC